MQLLSYQTPSHPLTLKVKPARFTTSTSPNTIANKQLHIHQGVDVKSHSSDNQSRLIQMLFHPAPYSLQHICASPKRI